MTCLRTIFFLLIHIYLVGTLVIGLKFDAISDLFLLLNAKEYYTKIVLLHIPKERRKSGTTDAMHF